MPQPRDPVRVAAAVKAADCSRWLDLIDQTLQGLPPAHPDVAAGGSSLRLTALGETVCADMLQVLLAGPVRHTLLARLGEQPGCMLSQCWARLQWPAAQRPPDQHPHSWHQDGALGCRFDGPGTSASDTLGDLLTVWLPLVDCGADAPSLQWLQAPPCGLLQPAALTDAALLERFGPACRRHAVLSAGDALVFEGALVHRSHVDAAMTRRRVSVEWRFVDGQGLPARWADERVQAWPRASYPVD